MSALAFRLGVKPPSLYKDVDSIAEIHRTISTNAARELGNEIERASHGHSGSSAIHAISHAYRNWATLHPDLYRALQMPPAHGDVQHQVILGAVSRTFATTIDSSFAEHTPTQVDRTRATRAALHGFVSLEAAHAFGVNIDIDRSFERTIHGLIVAFYRDD